MPSKFSPIAVTGVSAIFPGSTDAHGFWRDILAGRDLITEVPASRWLLADHYDPDPKADDKTYCKRGSFLGEIDFDPIEFGVQPAAMNATDTCQMLALIAARQVLDDSVKNQFREVDRERASVILGVTSGQQLFLNVTCRLQRGVWMKALRESGVDEAQSAEICDRITNSYVPWQENTFPGLLGNVVAGRIANRFNLGGTNCVIDAACASSLSALAMAVDELHLGHSDLVITGGADTFNDAPMFVAFSKTPALSRTGDCRPFSDKADGTILGEGVSLFALRRLEDAERDGNRIYAVIRGLGSSSDGRSKSIYAPVPEGQAKALRRCYESAGYGPETVGMVEAHGTGTVAGDAAEFEGLRQVFSEAQKHRPDSEENQWCALGSIKSQIGHTKAAAGAANLFKATMALHHRILPPTIKVDRPNPKLNLEQSPFYLNTQTRPWVRPENHPRRASISSFGFGGTNFHVALEEYEGKGVNPPRHWNAAGELVLLAADSQDALNQKCRNFSAKATDANLAELARDSQQAFDAAQPFRLAAVCDYAADAKKRLDPANRAMPGVYSGSGALAGRTAFVFPGQGSQYPGMTADVSMAFSEAQSAWDGAPWLAGAVFPSPVYDDEARRAQATRLTQTEWAQPAIGAASAALLNILRKLEVTPDCVCGHSFGEITALYASGGTDFDTMVNIARKRGELMAIASETPGGMLSVRHSANQLREWISEWGVDLSVANLNGPSQTVLSGSIVAIEEAETLLKKHGNGVVRLPVSTAFHSPLVAPAAGAFREHLEDCEIVDGDLPFYANFDGELHPVDATALRDRLADQVSSSVRFHEMVDRMYEDGVRTFVEVGPSAVLSGLVKSILGDRPYTAIPLDRQGANGVVALWHGLGQLAALGVPMNWAALRAQHDIQPQPPAQEKKKFIVKINGGNFGRPYPDLSAAVPNSAAPSSLGVKVLPKPAARPVAQPVVPTVVREERPIVAAPAPVPVPVPAKVPAPVPAAQPAPVPVAVRPAAAPVQESTELYRVFQESISSAHSGWQSNLAKGHEEYLKAMESAYFAALGAPVQAYAAPVALPVPAPAIQAPAVPAPPPPVAALPAPVAAPAPVAPAPIAKTPTPTPVPVPVVKPVAAAPAAPKHNVRETLWALVSDKTGYPSEMLEPGMALEADLGIDSIKRVEIFAAVQDALPGLPELPHSDIGRLRTLDDIALYLEGHLSQAAPAAVPAAPAAVRATPSADIRGILLGVIAEKTGYPSEMLEPGMALEADLGIDSIKRVEIFAAVQDAIPGLPELPHSDIGRLRTLDDIAVYLEGHMGQAAPAALAAAVRTAPAADIRGILLGVIAEKTGYPSEMLEPGMALEADLGIDSIKRVEIFAAVQDAIPGLPELPHSDIGRLRTLDDIAVYLEGHMGGPAPAATPVIAAAAPAVDMQAILLEVIAEKTGYPVEMLEPGMGLEADLGIDSIKRVEIFAAMSERVPGMKEPDMAELGPLKSIADVAGYLQGAPVAATAPAATAAATAKATQSGLRHAVIIRPAPATNHSILNENIGSISITDDGLGIADALSELLIVRGYEAAVSYEVPEGVHAVICLAGLRQFPSRAAAIAANRSAFDVARSAATTIADSGLFVTVQDTGGRFEPADEIRAWAGGLSALAKTAALEWPKAAIKAIDVEIAGRTPLIVAQAILNELLQGGPETEVGLNAKGERVTVETTSGPAAGSAIALGPDSVIVASGGARGVTAQSLIHLAKQTHSRFVLLGRTPLADEPSFCNGVAGENALRQAFVAFARARGEAVAPAAVAAQAAQVIASREVNDVLAAFKTAGSEARYIAVDIRDRDAVSKALDEVRAAWGPIAGLVHGAGVLADKLIAELTPERFEAVFSTKVEGLEALLDATRQDPLRFICVFSSVAARNGNPGQAAYAMANEVMNRVAHAEAALRPATRVKSLNWGPWDGGMVTPALRRHFEQAGIGMLGIEEGAGLFADEILHGSDGEIEVVLGHPLSAE